ncbi:histidine phosphatase family protein [Actinomyces sp.]
MKLALIRHGQTPANITASLDTRLPGLPLTELGLSQAENLKERFVREVAGQLDALTVSAMKRTQQTAEPLCELFGVTPVVTAQIREVSAGDLEMSCDPVAIRVYVEACAAWMLGDFSHRMPGAEDGYEFLGRVIPEIQAVMERAYSVAADQGIGALVAHGGLIRVISAYLSEDIRQGIPLTRFMSNTGIVVFDVDIEEIRALSSNGVFASLSAISWDGDQLRGD